MIKLIFKISHKYLNHGRMCRFKSVLSLVNYNNIYTCSYSTMSSSTLPYKNVKLYEDAFLMKKSIIKDNKNKSGIYKWTNKLTNDSYVGQSIDLSKRFIRYFNLSYLRNRGTLAINRALIKYGFSSFQLEILEYCDIADLNKREQYYLDTLKPRYNILKIAGSSSGHKLSEETKAKISQSLKGVYVKEKSALYGRKHSEETKALMSLKKSNVNNPLFGKTHSEETKELMRLKALGRKHSEETGASCPCCPGPLRDPETVLKMSASKGYPVYVYEKCDSKGFQLIGSFVSIRKAANFLGISPNTVRLYINSGEIFNDRYKFTGGNPK
jgi:group I intron endonuclease